MTTQPALVARVRTELRDEGTTFLAENPGDGASKVFDLPVEFVEATGLVVYLDTLPSPTVLNPTTDYILDARAGRIIFTIPPDETVNVIVQGTFYNYFVTADITTVVGDAFLQHTAGRNLTYSTLPGIEEVLVAYRGTIECLWILATDASYDIDIHSPEGMTIPRSQRFQQLLQLIQMYTEKYQYLCRQLNVGLDRIEVLELRRTSRTIGRLVPKYVPREFDDPGNEGPERVFPPISRGLLAGEE